MSELAPKRRVTRQDVATAAGTSVAVVSYVINNGPRRVAEKTRQRVLAAIRQTGYRPNAIAQALASGKTKTYGLVVPNIANPFISSMAHALQQEAFSDGQILLLGDADDDREQEQQLINNLLLRQVDGVIYTSVDRHPDMALITSSTTPFVMIDSVQAQSNVNVIFVDEKAAAYQATAHLIEHGYQEIAIICGPLTMLNTQDRLQGWRDALEDSGLEVDDAWIFSTEYTKAGGYQATQQLLKGRLPRALFATNERQALGCLKALSEAKVNVPEQVAVVCFNGTQEAKYAIPSLTSVRQPVNAIAKEAIKMLREWNDEPKIATYDFTLEIGESCGCKGRGN